MKWAKKKEELIWWTNSSMKHQGGITILMYLSIKIHNQPNNIFTSSTVLKSKEKKSSGWLMYKTNTKQQNRRNKTFYLRAGLVGSVCWLSNINDCHCSDSSVLSISM